MPKRAFFGGGLVSTVDTFGWITATGGAAIRADNAILESGSVTKGQVLGGNEANLFSVFAGANIAGATFDGGGGANELKLLGGGTGTLAVSTVTNVQTFTKMDSGTWTLTGTTTAVTPWTVSGGVLSISNDANLGNSTVLGASAAALTLNGGTLQVTANTDGIRAINLGASGGTFDVSAGAGVTENGPVSGTGALTKTGAGSLNIGGLNSGSDFSGDITVNGGTLGINVGIGGLNSGITINSGGSLDVRNREFKYGALSGTGGSLNMGGSLLTFASSSNSTFAGQITGDGASRFTKAGTGTLTLTGNSNFGAAIVISEGTLQFGNGGTTGLFAGRDITNSGRLVFNRSDSLTFDRMISGPGTVTQAGSGTLTLSAGNSYTGATSVNAGTLNVTGGIASSSVSVANGATLSGSGKVGATTIASGGTLKPGDSGAPGTLTVSGNLTLASGANYVDIITPTAAGLVSVSGTASINGTASQLASGSYTTGQRLPC